MMLQQFLSVTRQISSEFIYQQGSALATASLRPQLLPITLPNVELF